MGTSEFFWDLVEATIRGAGGLTSVAVWVARMWDWSDWARMGAMLGKNMATIEYVLHQFMILVPEIELLPDILVVFGIIFVVEAATFLKWLIFTFLPFWNN